jgi:hypothetical protein
MYAANTPLLYTDPSGRCYDQLGFLRDVEPGNCHNLDMAIKIFNHPNASLKERTAAYAYVSTWTASHAMLLVGAGFGGGALLTESVIAAGAAATEVSLLGAAAMANVPTVAKTAVGVSLVVADKVDDALMYFYAALGDEQAVAEYQALQLLGTSDPSPVCDVLAAGIIFGGRGGKRNLAHRVQERLRQIQEATFRLSQFSSPEDFIPGPNTAFHGIYLPWGDDFVLEASEGAIVRSTGQSLTRADGYVRNGGHAALMRKLEQAKELSILDEKYFQTRAFTLHYEEPNKYGVSWLSRGVNGTNFRRSDNMLPEDLRQDVLDALRRVYGEGVYSK